jgi:hypothetical protein
LIHALLLSRKWSRMLTDGGLDDMVAAANRTKMLLNEVEEIFGCRYNMNCVRDLITFYQSSLR